MKPTAYHNCLAVHIRRSEPDARGALYLDGPNGGPWYPATRRDNARIWGMLAFGIAMWVIGFVIWGWL